MEQTSAPVATATEVKNLTFATKIPTSKFLRDLVEDSNLFSKGIPAQKGYITKLMKEYQDEISDMHRMYNEQKGKMGGKFWYLGSIKNALDIKREELHLEELKTFYNTIGKLLVCEYLIFEEQLNGDLCITATDAGRKFFVDFFRRNVMTYDKAWLHIMKDSKEAGLYQHVLPEQCAALTNSPLIAAPGTKFGNFDDHYECQPITKTKAIWYFNDYMTVHEFKEWQRGLPVVFTKS